LVAWDADRPVGRVMAHVHRASNERHGEKTGFFGLFECPDDESIARALIDAVCERHRARGLERLRGPYDLTIRECVGVITGNFDEPAAFNQSWNEPHVPRLLEACGMTVAMRMATFRAD